MCDEMAQSGRVDSPRENHDLNGRDNAYRREYAEELSAPVKVSAKQQG